MSHAPAVCFQIKDHGFIREGYQADILLVDLGGKATVTKNTLLYKCGWSPLEGMTLPARITHTLVNGEVVYQERKIVEKKAAQRLLFDR